MGSISKKAQQQKIPSSIEQKQRDEGSWKCVGGPTKKRLTFRSGSETRHGTSKCVSESVIKMASNSFPFLLMNGFCGSVCLKESDISSVVYNLSVTSNQAPQYYRTSY